MFQILTHIEHREKVLLMRILIAVLVLILTLQSFTKADDIKDFQIEGISIGDSALDFFSEAQIKNNSKNCNICSIRRQSFLRKNFGN